MLPRRDQIVVNNMKRATATSNNGSIQVGDNGMKCAHCDDFETYRSSTSSKTAHYDAARHLSTCESLPKDQRDQLSTFEAKGIYEADWAIIRGRFLQEEIDNALIL